nr:MAG TPA: hypothetical protein [Bacteriophage sp.]
MINFHDNLSFRSNFINYKIRAGGVELPYVSKCLYLL